MKVTIYYNGAPAGQGEIRSEGLYWDISCRVEAQGLLRLYGIEGWDSEYLGIPGTDGRLHTRRGKQHLPHGISAILASPDPRGEWKPWMGTVEGVEVRGYLLPVEEGILLGLPPEESIKFPQWIERMEQIQVQGRSMPGLRLDAFGRLPLKEREREEKNNETMDFGNSSGRLPSDLPAGDGYGGASEDGDEADGG